MYIILDYTVYLPRIQVHVAAVVMIFCTCDDGSCCEELGAYCVTMWINSLLLCFIQVTGVIQDSAGHVRYVLSGTWDEKLEGAPVLNTIESSKGKVMYETGETKVLWQRRYPA